ncbi:MAG TPA: acyl-CoA dehydrogenase family protein [Acidimicrobiales bacterium]|jgi:alkylation response protein AidB-like acyl-CoA dehydrogenase|nr:acyl-CoA dehydrogenase family protein [Acidimicrobiales bacterium]
MLINPIEEQEFFRATTERFLVEHAPPDALRSLRDDAAGFDREYWRRGAELGWTSLLVDEAHGGGSISGAGLVDLSLVAYEFGHHAAPGPLTATNVVASALSDHPAAGEQAEVLSGLLSGETIGTWCAPELGARPGEWRTGVVTERGGEGLVLRGTVRPVEHAGQADQLLVAARDGAGLTQVLVPTGAEGITVEPLETVDLTRRFGAVSFDGVRVSADAIVGAAGDASSDVARQLRRAVTMLNCEAVGAMQGAFDMTVEWSFDRYSFGRPLASYQALKHRFADMMSWLQAGHAISDAACAAAQDDQPNADELASAAKAFIGRHGGELIQDCVQLHGGIGVTFDHDLHLYLRRLTVNRSVAGTPREHLRRIAGLVEAREGAAA